MRRARVTFGVRFAFFFLLGCLLIIPVSAAAPTTTRITVNTGVPGAVAAACSQAWSSGFLLSSTVVASAHKSSVEFRAPGSGLYTVVELVDTSGAPVTAAAFAAEVRRGLAHAQYRGAATIGTLKTRTLRTPGGTFSIRAEVVTP